MDTFTAFKIALKSLLKNKGRTFLTMLGIIIGVGTIIALMAATEGAQRKIISFVESLGNNIIYVRAGTKTKGGVRGSWGSITTLKPSDAIALQKECPHIKYATPIIYLPPTQVVYRSKNTDALVIGVNANAPEIFNWKIQEGSFFNHQDVKSSVKMCVIGNAIKEDLFSSNENCIGKTIRISKIPFKIIGVGSTETSGENRDNRIYIPYTTAMQRLYRQDHIEMIACTATSREDFALAKEEITDLLRMRHRIPEHGDNDFMLFSQEDIIKAVKDFIRNATILSISVASVSLIVGGIGIMNIMLVTITERTKEIGIRMALGARRRDILKQFLIEAITISMIGGIIGIGFGYLLGKIIEKFTKFSIPINATSVLLALLFSLAVGSIFGFYPAWKASKMNPIEALRYE